MDLPKKRRTQNPQQGQAVKAARLSGGLPLSDVSGDVLAQALVALEQSNDGIYGLIGSGVGRRENGSEIVLQQLVELVVIGFFNAQQDGQGFQVFAGSAGHVT